MIGEEPWNVTEDNSKTTVEDNETWIDIVTTVPIEDGEEAEVERLGIDPADLNAYISVSVFGSKVHEDEVEIIDIKDLKNGKFMFSYNITLPGKTMISLNDLRKLVK